jgi:hypothetical protein
MRTRYGHALNFFAVTLLVFGAYFLFAALPPRPANVVERFGVPSHQTSQETPPPKPTYDVASLPQIAPGQQISFGTGKDKRALISGWSAPEPGGVWSQSHDATIVFSTHCNGCAITDPMLELKGNLYLPVGGYFQRIEFWINGSKVDQVQVATPQFACLTELKGIKIHDGADVVLSLRFPDAIRPKGDPRLLAINLSSIRLVP